VTDEEMADAVVEGLTRGPNGECDFCGGPAAFVTSWPRAYCYRCWQKEDEAGQFTETIVERIVHLVADVFAFGRMWSRNETSRR
jgi:hypothetical protein